MKPTRQRAGSIAATLIALCLHAPSARAQATYTWSGANGQPWTVAANWTPQRTSPATDDILVLDGAVTPSPTILGIPTESIGQLVVRNGAIAGLIAPSPGPVTLTLTGGSGPDLDLAAGCRLMLVATGSTTFQVSLGAGATGLVAGTLAPIGNNARVLSPAAGAMVIVSGGVVEYGGSGSVFGTTGVGSVVFQSGATYLAMDTNDVFGAASPNSVVLFEAGSTYRLEASPLPPLSGRTFANLVVDESSLSPTPATGSAPFIVDDITILSGNPRIQVTDVRIRGNVHLQGGGLTFNPTSAQTITLDGPVAQTLSGQTGNWSFNNNAHLRIVNPAGVTLASGHLSPSLATVLAGAKLVAGAAPQASLQNNGSFTVHGTLQLNPGANPPSGLPFSYGAGSHLVFANTGLLTLSNLATWPTAGPTHVSLIGGGRVALPAGNPRTVQGTLALTNGILDMSGATLTIGAAGTIAGGSAASHVRGAVARTLSVSGSAQTRAFPVGDATTYAPVVLDFPAVSSGGVVTAFTSAGDHASIATSGIVPAKSVNRTWSVTNSGAVFTPASATFTFAPGDVDPGANPLVFGASKFAAASWTSLGATGQTATGMTATGIASFSDFQIGEPVPPCGTAITLVRSDYATGAAPTEVAAADFDDDGVLDLAVTDYGSHAVSIFEGLGSGALGPRVPLAAGTNPVSLDVGDLNADGHLDLFVTNWSDHSGWTYHGDGSGGFLAPASVYAAASARPISGKLARLDAGPSLDVFLPEWSNVRAVVLAGDGLGGFGLPVPFATDDGPYDAALGDLNGDGNLDAVVANRGRLVTGTTISVLIGDGAGGFAAPVHYTVGTQPRAVALGDLDGDSDLDVAVANEGSLSISILFGDGTGNLAAQPSLATPGIPVDVAIGHLNADSHADLAVALQSANGIAIFRADCFGGYVRDDFATDGNCSRVILADMDGSGSLDVVATNGDSATVSVFRNLDGPIGIPEASFSTVPPVILASAEGGSCFDVVVRDANNSPVPGSAVVVDFGACPVTFCPAQPGVSGNTVTLVTNAAGIAEFCICLSSPPAPCAVTVRADGVTLAVGVPLQFGTGRCPEPTWTMVAGSGPASRRGLAMAPDGIGRILLFGGRGTGLPLGDFWSWNGVVWTALSPGALPAARAQHAMVYDSKRNRVVLFGGESGGGLLGDTWEWNGTAWTQVAATGPSARRGHAMAYDATRERVVLFGGWDGALRQDTWTWDGTNWLESNPAAAPGAREEAAATYDPGLGRVILMGGDDGGELDDTWEWDGTTWTEVDVYAAVTPHPDPRAGHGLAYAPNCARPILVGGVSDANTWRWRGADWAIESPTVPGVRRDFGMAFDPVRRQILVFGGEGPVAGDTLVFGDTWALCSPCDTDPAPVDSSGGAAFPGWMVFDGEPELHEVDEVVGNVDELYPDFETGTDLWFPNDPCPPSVGGTLPPGASMEALVDSLESLGPEMAGVAPEEIADSLRSWNEQAMADTLNDTDDLEAAGPVSGSYVEPAPGTRPPGCYLFGGRDIVFVHGFMTEPVLENLMGDAPPEWETTSNFPANDENPEFYNENGYWKAKARSYWAAHINKFFKSRGIRNRYVIVSWPTSQRLATGVQAVLTQIADAMGPSHLGVKFEPGDVPTGFGSPSFVIVSHSTGSLLADVAMAAAKHNDNLDAEYIADHCKAHIALHGALGGTDIATYTLKAIDFLDSGGGPPWMETVRIALDIMDATGAINLDAANESVLKDLVPHYCQWKHGRKYVRKTPVRTLTVSGGHPTQLFPLKHIVMQGFDDGLLHANSQEANPNLAEVPDPFPNYPLWPSGFLTFPLLGHIWNYDMGNEVERTIPWYMDLVLDPLVNQMPLALQTYGSYLSSGPNPHLSPAGMQQSVLFDPSLLDFYLFGVPVGIGGRHRYPNHFSFLNSTSEHLATIDNLGTGEYPDYREAWELIGGTVKNREETRVITDDDIYTAYSTNGEPSQALLMETLGPKVQERVKGKYYDITIKIPPFFKWTFRWWVWKRRYFNVAGWETNHEMDFVYRYVLNNGSTQYPCSTSVVDVPGHAAGLRFAIARVSPTPSRGATRLEFTAPSRGTITLSVFDVAGRLVRRTHAACEGGPVGLAWDGRASNGRVALPGVYLVRARFESVTGDAEEARTRIVRLE